MQFPIGKRYLGAASQLALVVVFVVALDALYRHRSLLEGMSPTAFRRGFVFLIVLGIVSAFVAMIPYAGLLIAFRKKPRWSTAMTRIVQFGILGLAIAANGHLLTKVIVPWRKTVDPSVLHRFGVITILASAAAIVVIAVMRYRYRGALATFTGDRLLSFAVTIGSFALLLAVLGGTIAVAGRSSWVAITIATIAYVALFRRDLVRCGDAWRVAAIPICVIFIGAGTLLGSAIARRVTELERRAPIVVDPTRKLPGIDYIIVLSYDGLSAERMSLYGNPRVTTPHLDAFARESTVFERAHAEADATQQSLASIHTGVHYATNRLRAYGRYLAGEDLVGFMPRVFDTIGWDSAYATYRPNPGQNDIIGRVAMYNDASPDLLEQFYGPRALLALRRLADRSRIAPYEWIRALLDEYAGGLPEVFDRYETDRADAFFRVGSDERPTWDKLGWARRYLTEYRPEHAYLRIHTYPPHAPYYRIPPYAGRFLPDVSTTYQSIMSRIVWNEPPLDPALAPLARELQLIYEEYLLAVDAEFGKFLDFLRETGLYDRTLLIVTADHGSAFAHDELFHVNRVFYEQTMRIPLIIHVPGQRDGRRVPEYVQQVDVQPTILDILGVAAPPWMEGRSLRPLMEGSEIAREEFRKRVTFSQGISPPLELVDDPTVHDRYAFVAYQQPYKLIYRFIGNHAIEEQPIPDQPKTLANFFARYPRIELFNLDRDPGETQNLAERHPEIRDALFAAIRERINGIRQFQATLR